MDTETAFVQEQTFRAEMRCFVLGCFKHYLVILYGSIGSLCAKILEWGAPMIPSWISPSFLVLGLLGAAFCAWRDQRRMHIAAQNRVIGQSLREIASIEAWHHKLLAMPFDDYGNADVVIRNLTLIHQQCVDDLNLVILTSLESTLRGTMEAQLVQTAWSEFKSLNKRFCDMPANMTQKLEAELYGHLDNPPTSPETGNAAMQRCLFTIINSLRGVIDTARNSIK